MKEISNSYELKQRKLTDKELKRVAQYFEILIEIDQAEKARFRRLEQGPKGFSMPGEGRSCSLCRQSIHNEGFFDKWGFKCLNCQNAIDKRKIPDSVCRDWDNKKFITDTTLAMELSVSIQKIRKLIYERKIIGRRIPNGPYIILRKNNSDLKDIIQREFKSTAIPGQH